MKDLNTSLLREKFVLHDPHVDLTDTQPVVALSNRLVFALKNKGGETVETFTVRAQNMHCCVRMAARLIQAFTQGGAILNRAVEFEWDMAWRNIVSDYERKFNPDLWVSVYHRGKIVFESGKRHPFLDVIEKCAFVNNGDYEDSIPMAEDAFKNTGKVVKIEYNGNVALAINFDQREARCGIILRGADKTTTFNFTASPHAKLGLNFSQCLYVAAAYLEGIQLAFMIGMSNVKMQYGIIERHSDEEKQHREAIRRLKNLDVEIVNFETAFHVRYRPEHPSFQHTVNDAEQLAAKILRPEQSPDFLE